MHIRPRRNRKTTSLREMVCESGIFCSDLLAPLFVLDQVSGREPITTLPGQFRLGMAELLNECRELQNLGVPAVALFPVVQNNLKTKNGKAALDLNFFYYRVISEIRNKFPNLSVMTDVALDPYSSDGHDGIVDSKTGEILNDETLEVLGQMALLQARAGASIIGPSDMMDGRIEYIRNILESENQKDINIMAYSAKYASSFYGPFRDALDSAPKFGDKKSYQMDYRNKREALREALLDQQEGADILMVKPGLAYLDVISYLRENTQLPIAAYNVSGEYAMVKAAVASGWANEENMVNEILTSFKRAGAKIILTYHAKDAALWLQKN